MNNNAVIYTRVSSDEQKKGGFSLDYQAKQGQEYAALKNLNVLKIYTESYTGKRPGRPLFNEMINFVKKYKVEHLIFLVHHRASRNGVDSAQLVYMAEYLGFNIHLIQDGLILNKKSKPTDFMIFEVANCMANFYPRNLSIDVSTKMREKAEQGYYPSRAVVGYKNQRIRRRSYIQIDPEKAPLIKKIFELYSTREYSYESLAKKLREEGFYISPSVKIGKSNVEDILKNPIYMGDFVWNGKRYYNGKHEPIISRELWNICQQIINERNKPKAQKRDFVFSNLIRCEKCGCYLVGELKKGKYIYYHCTGNKGGHCKKGSYIREEKIEQAIISNIFDILQNANKDVLELAKKCLELQYKEVYGDNEARINNLQKEIDKNKARADKLFNLYLDGEVSQEIYSKKKIEIETIIDEMNLRLDSYKNTGTDILRHAQNMFELFENAPTSYLQGTTQEKRKLLKMLCSNFSYNGETLTITIKKAFQILFEIASLKMVESKFQNSNFLALIRLFLEEIKKIENLPLLKDCSELKKVFNNPQNFSKNVICNTL